MLQKYYTLSREFILHYIESLFSGRVQGMDAWTGLSGGV